MGPSDLAAPQKLIFVSPYPSPEALSQTPFFYLYPFAQSLKNLHRSGQKFISIGWLLL
jgi:hypothetical protein